MGPSDSENLEAGPRKQPAHLDMRTRTFSTWIALALSLASMGAWSAAGEPPGPKVPAALTQTELEPLLQDRVLNLDQAIALALKSSPNMAGALAQFRKARGVVSQSNAAFLPQITLGAQALQFDRKNEVDFGSLMGGSAPPITIAEEWNPSLGATVGWTIDLHGAIRSAKSQAEFMALAARIDIDRVRNETVLQVRLAYLNALKSQGAQSVARANYDAVAVRLKNAEQQERAGNAAKFDVISARRDLAEAELDVLSASAAVDNAFASLKNVIGVEQSTVLALHLGTKVESDVSQAQGDLLLLALSMRPEVLRAEAEQRAMAFGIRVASSSNRPSLTAGLGFTVQPNHGAFTNRELGFASLTLSIPLFDGGLARAKTRQAEADQTSAEAQLRNTKDQVGLQLYHSLTNLNLARERREKVEATVAEAREAYRLALVRYGIGVTQSSVVSPQLELSAAQAALTRAEMTLVEAEFDLQIAKATLIFVLGESPKGEKS